MTGDDMSDEPDHPDELDEPTLEDGDSVATLVIGTGVPPTSPNFGVPRYSSNDPADFPTQGNAITDTFDAQAAKRGAIVDADIAPGAAISKAKLAGLAVVDADVAAGAAIQEAKLALATDAAPNVGSRRTLGPGANQAAPGNDPRLGGGAASQVSLPVLDVGQPGQIRAGRQLAQADFTALGLSPPTGLWNLSDLTDASGNARGLTNKGAVPFGVGINGLATTAAQFAGSTGQALYISDTGAADPFRIRTGSWGCWLRTAKRGVDQNALCKSGAPPQAGMILKVEAGNHAAVIATIDGTNWQGPIGVSDIADDRWHFLVGVHDGSALMIYVDGTLEGLAWIQGVIFASTGPVNIGGQNADGATAATLPFYGRIDEAFITADVLTADQVRALYCAKIAHGLGSMPTAVKLAVRRRRRGAALAAGDFPTPPLRLHNFTGGSLADEGSNGVALVNNNAAVPVAGADGAQGGAFNFANGANQSLSSTDAGLPTAGARSYGAWLKATGFGTIALVWGTQNTGDSRLFVANSGAISSINASDTLTGVFMADGAWHFAVCVEDPAAADGVKRKLYLDGRVVGNSTVLTAIVLAGANKFRVSSNQDGSLPFIGQIDTAFICGYALTTDQIAALYLKGSQALAPSVKNAGDHVESADATSLYAVFDLDAQHQVDLAVTG